MPIHQQKNNQFVPAESPWYHAWLDSNHVQHFSLVNAIRWKIYPTRVIHPAICQGGFNRSKKQ